MRLVTAGGKCLFRADPKKFVMTYHVLLSREHAHVLLEKN